MDDMMGGGMMGGGMMGGRGGGNSSDADGDTKFEAKEYIFVLQMAWTPKSKEERMEAKKLRLEAEAKAKEQAAKNAGNDAPANGSAPQ